MASIPQPIGLNVVTSEQHDKNYWSQFKEDTYNTFDVRKVLTTMQTLLIPTTRAIFGDGAGKTPLDFNKPSEIDGVPSLSQCRETVLPNLHYLLQYLDIIRTILFSNPNDLRRLANRQDKFGPSIKRKLQILPGSELFFADVKRLYDTLGLPLPRASFYKPGSHNDEPKNNSQGKPLDQLIKEYEQELPGFKKFCLTQYSHRIFNNDNPTEVAAFNEQLLKVDGFRSIFDPKSLEESPIRQYSIQYVIANLYTPEIFSSDNSAVSFLDASDKKRGRDDGDDNKGSPPTKDRRLDPEIPKAKPKDEKDIKDEDDGAVDLNQSPLIGVMFDYLAKQPEQTKTLFFQAERIYHFISALYAFVSDLANILTMAVFLTEHRDMKKTQNQLEHLTRFEDCAFLISHVRNYYFVHVYSSTLPYFDYTPQTKTPDPAATNETEPKKAKKPRAATSKALRTLIIADSITLNSVKSKFGENELAALRLTAEDTNSSDHTSKFIRRGLFDHLWANIGHHSDKSLPPLYMPFIFWSAFQTVRADIGNSKSKLIKRAQTATFRGYLLFYLRVYRGLILINQNDSHEKGRVTTLNPAQRQDLTEVFPLHSQLERDRITQAWLRTTLLLNRGVSLIYKAGDIIPYSYQLGSPTKGKRKGVNAAVETISVYDWVFKQFKVEDAETNASFLTPSTQQASLNMIVDGSALRHPLVLYEWLGVTEFSFQYLTLSHLHETIWIPSIPQVKRSNLHNLFTNIKTKKSWLALINCDMSVIPRALAHDKSDSSLLYLNTLYIIDPLPAAELRHTGIVGSDAPVTIYVRNDGLLDQIEYSQLRKVINTNVESEPFFLPAQMLAIRDGSDKTDKHININVSFVSEVNRYAIEKAGNRGGANPVDALTVKEVTEFRAMVDKLISFSLRTEDSKTVSLIIETVPFKLENFLACQKPLTVPEAAMNNYFQDVARWWWDAHLYGDPYNVTLPPEPTTGSDEWTLETLEQLRAVNKNHYLIRSLPYLGQHIERVLMDKNYLADAPDVKENIMNGKVLDEIIYEDGPKGVRHIKVKSHQNNNSLEDVRHLNEFKLVRIGQDVLNWLTDGTCMSTYSVHNTVPIQKADHVPSVVTDGLSLISHSYSTTKKDFQPIEFIKGSSIDLPGREEINNSILFTPRVKMVKGRGRMMLERNWMDKFCALKTDQRWGNLGKNTEFADIFCGFDGLAVMMSERNINVRKAHGEIKAKRKAIDKLYKLTKEALQNGDEVVSLSREIINTLQTKKKEDNQKEGGNGAPPAPPARQTDDVTDMTIAEAIRTVNNFYRTNDVLHSVAPTDPLVMILDLFDVDRLDVSQTVFTHRLDANDVHTLLMTDSCLRDGMRLKDLEILHIWPDPKTGFVISVPLDTVFLLMALKCIYSPVSPLDVYSRFQPQYDELFGDTQVDPSEQSKKQFIPRVKNPQFGNIHTTTLGKMIFKGVRIPLGNITNSYMATVPILQKEQELFESFSDDVTNYMFYNLNKRIKVVDDNVRERLAAIPSESSTPDAMDIDEGDKGSPNNTVNESTSETIKNPVELAIQRVADQIETEMPIWSCVSRQFSEDHTNKLIGQTETNRILWLPRCNTDFFERPMSVLSNATIIEPNPNTADIKNLTIEYEFNLPDTIELYYEHLYHVDTQYFDVLRPNEDDDLRYVDRDLMLLNDTWDFPLTNILVDTKEGDDMDIDDDDKDEQSTFIKSLTAAEAWDRHQVNSNFDFIIDHYKLEAAKVHDNILYSNFCLMSMTVLASILRQTGVSANNFFVKYAQWFTHDLCANLVAYQLPMDTYSLGTYRPYFDLENFERRESQDRKITETLSKNTGEEDDDDEKSDSNTDAVELATDAAELEFTTANEEKPIIYINVKLMLAMSNLTFRWTAEEKLKDLTAESTTVTEAELDQTPAQLEKQAQLEEMVKRYLSTYAHGDHSLDLYKWKWLPYEEKKRQYDDALYALRKYGASENVTNIVNGLKDFIEMNGKEYDKDKAQGLSLIALPGTVSDQARDAHLEPQHIKLYRSEDTDKVFMYTVDPKTQKVVLFYNYLRNYVPLPKSKAQKEKEKEKEKEEDPILMKCLQLWTPAENLLAALQPEINRDEIIAAARTQPQIQVFDAYNGKSNDSEAPLIPDDEMDAILDDGRKEASSPPSTLLFPSSAPKQNFQPDEVDFNDDDGFPSTQPSDENVLERVYNGLQQSKVETIRGTVAEIFRSEEFLDTLLEIKMLLRQQPNFLVSLPDPKFKLCLKRIAQAIVIVDGEIISEESLSEENQSHDYQIFVTARDLMEKQDDDPTDAFDRFRSKFKTSPAVLMLQDWIETGRSFERIEQLMRSVPLLDEFWMGLYTRLLNNTIDATQWDKILTEEAYPLLFALYVHLLVYLYYVLDQETNVREELRLNEDSYEAFLVNLTTVSTAFTSQLHVLFVNTPPPVVIEPPKKTREQLMAEARAAAKAKTKKQ
jgi:hypothetical protein